MPHRTLNAALAALALLLFAGVPGCSDTDTDDEHAHTDGDGHDHADDDGHGHGDADALTLGPVDIAGRAVTVELPAFPEPGEGVHAHVNVEGDPVDAVRAWIGNESGDGSLVARGAGDGPTYHIDLERPTLGGARALWVELEADGERTTGLFNPTE